MAEKGLKRGQVEHVARLAWLPISSNELQLFQAQLSEVVEYISVIAKSKISRSIQRIGNQKSKLGQTNVMRRDRAEGARTLSQEEATSGGKNVHNGLFVVPAIFEEV